MLKIWNSTLLFKRKGLNGQGDSADVAIAFRHRAEFKLLVHPVVRAPSDGIVVNRLRNHEPTTPSGDDVLGQIGGQSVVLVGLNGLPETFAKKGDKQMALPLPGWTNSIAMKADFAAKLESYVNNIFGQQANIWFEVQIEPSVELEWGDHESADVGKRSKSACVLDMGEALVGAAHFPEQALLFDHMNVGLDPNKAEIHLFWVASPSFRSFGKRNSTLLF